MSAKPTTPPCSVRLLHLPGWCVIAWLAAAAVGCGSAPFEASPDDGAHDASVDAMNDSLAPDGSDVSAALDVSTDQPRDGSLDALHDGGPDVPMDVPAPDVWGDALLDSPGTDADACVPTSCADLSVACGSTPNGCGGTLVCPSCASPTSCIEGKCCPPQAPVATWDATPAGANGTVCGLGSVSVNDGNRAGLACGGAGVGLIDGQTVTACIGADFGASLPIGPIAIRAVAATSACGVGCVGTDCGTGTAMRVFVGASKSSLAFVKSLAVPDATTDFSVVLPGPTRYVVVCRSGYGNTHDQIGIDSIRSAAVCP
jgi:hypothetical protein